MLQVRKFLMLSKQWKYWWCTITMVTIIQRKLNNEPSVSWKTRRSENDNTPQPLDQWTNSPFMGQQVGNCKSFTLTHYLADLFAMHCDPRASPSWIRHCIQLVGEVKVLSHNLSPTSYRLTFFWFHVNSPSYCYDKAFLKFCLQNPRSKS